MTIVGPVVVAAAHPTVGKEAATGRVGSSRGTEEDKTPVGDTVAETVGEFGADAKDGELAWEVGEVPGAVPAAQARVLPVVAAASVVVVGAVPKTSLWCYLVVVGRRENTCSFVGVATTTTKPSISN